MNIVKPGRDLARVLRQERMRKLLEKIQWQVSLEYLQEAKATMDFAVGISKEVYDEDVGYELADLYYSIKNFKQAFSILTQIQPLEAQKIPRILNLKGMCCLHLKKLKLASELFEMCILIDPDHVNSLNNLGNLAMHQNDFDKCKLYYNKSKDSSISLYKRAADPRTRQLLATTWQSRVSRQTTKSACLDNLPN